LFASFFPNKSAFGLREGKQKESTLQDTLNAIALYLYKYPSAESTCKALALLIVISMVEEFLPLCDFLVQQAICG
jgi:hypothetical protein